MVAWGRNAHTVESMDIQFDFNAGLVGRVSVAPQLRVVTVMWAGVETGARFTATAVFDLAVTPMDGVQWAVLNQLPSAAFREVPDDPQWSPLWSVCLPDTVENELAILSNNL